MKLVVCMLCMFFLTVSADFIAEVQPDGDACECNVELNSDKLGKSTWFLLHEVVKHADPLDDIAFALLLKTLGVLYPCPHCREHITEYLATHRVEMTEEWLCTFHNAVNEKLNKTLVDCN